MPRLPELPSKPTPQLEERARWLVEHIAEHPAMTFGDRMRAARKHLGIGKTAAELAYKRALEMRRDYTADVVRGYRDHVVRASLEDEAEARARGDFRAANRIRMDLSRMLGIHEPDKVELTVKPPRVMDLAPLTDEQLELLEAAGIIQPALPALTDEPGDVIDVEPGPETSHGAGELVVLSGGGDDDEAMVPALPDPDTVG